MEESIVSHGQGVPFESRTNARQSTNTDHRDIWSVSTLFKIPGNVGAYSDIQGTAGMSPLTQIQGNREPPLWQLDSGKGWLLVPPLSFQPWAFDVACAVRVGLWTL